MDAVKFTDKAKGLFEGMAIPFGGPKNGRDLDGEAFTKDTNLHLDAYSNRPIIYHHGKDKVLQWDQIASEKSVEQRDKGIWLEGQLDLAHQYADIVTELLDKGALGYSSGAHPRSVDKSDDGIIKEWFWHETSLTTIPSNPLAVVSMKCAKSTEGVIPIEPLSTLFRKLGRLPDAEEAEKAFSEFLEANGSEKASFTDEMLERFIRLEMEFGDMRSDVYVLKARMDPDGNIKNQNKDKEDTEKRLRIMALDHKRIVKEAV